MGQEQLYRQEMRRQVLRSMLEIELHRRPIWPETGEEGEFVAVIGWLTGAGVLRCPYYKTASGIYFALSKRDNTMDKPFLLDMEKIQKQRLARFYSPEVFINGDAPSEEPILEPYQEDSST